jgi:hypothetical protein
MNEDETELVLILKKFWKRRPQVSTLPASPQALLPVDVIARFFDHPGYGTCYRKFRKGPVKYRVEKYGQGRTNF